MHHTGVHITTLHMHTVHYNLGQHHYIMHFLGFKPYTSPTDHFFRADSWTLDNQATGPTVQKSGCLGPYGIEAKSRRSETVQVEPK